MGARLHDLTVRSFVGGKIKTGSPDVVYGGPTKQLLPIIDTEAILETILGAVLLGAILLEGGFFLIGAFEVGGIVASITAAAQFALGFKLATEGFELVGWVGDQIGTGWRDILQGTAGFAMLFAFKPRGSQEMATSTPSLRESAPINIPEHARVVPQQKVGYDQVKYTWGDGQYKYEARWHTRTPGAPAGQGNSWVVERITPGTSTGQQKTSHILLSDGTWVPKSTWYDAIAARKAGVATPEQVRILDSGHHPG